MKKKLLLIEPVNSRYDEKELKKPLGGSETIFLFLLRWLKKRKDIKLEVIFRDEEPKKKKYDAVICYRDPQPLFWFDLTKSERNILYCQDMPSEQVVQSINQLINQGKLHKVVFLSHYQKEAYIRECPGIDENRKVIMLENGLDLSLFDSKIKKEKAFIYASTPYRGLDVLLKLWPKIYEKLPDWELRVAGSINMYDVSTNTEEQNSISGELNAVGKDLYNKKIPGIKWLGGLSQADLIKEMEKCEGLLYPCTFPETSCHVLNCAFHAGATPIVSTAGGAISEKVCTGENGILVPGDPHTEAFIDEYANVVIDTVQSGRIKRFRDINRGAYLAWDMERIVSILVDKIFYVEELEGNNVKILGITCTLNERGSSSRYNFSNLLWYQPYDLLTEDIVGLPIDQARNAACSMAIYRRADWLLFLDDDNFVGSYFIMELMKRVEKYKADIVVGNYFYKVDDYLIPMVRTVRKFDSRALTFTETEDIPEEELNGPGYEFNMAGAGCLLISVATLKKMGRPWFRTQSTMHGRHTGEDTYFFQEAKRMGIKVWVAWDIPVAHVDLKEDKWYGRPNEIEKIQIDLNSWSDKILYRKDKNYVMMKSN